jgi:tetratricopeptide (TPR) repeat protein
LLSGLVDKSLLRYTDSRYEMHELLRQFAGEKLDAHPEVASATRTAHSAYYAAFLKDREDRLEGAVHREIVLETLQDMDNIRAAQHTLIEQCNAPLIADFLRPLFHLLDAQSLYAEGEQVFRRMATCLRGLDPFITAQPTARAMVLQGIFLHLLTRYGEAQAVFEATLPAMRKLHADGNAAVVWELRLQLSYMGALHYARGDYPNAKIYYEAAIELFREAGIMAQAGEALMRLSEIAVVMGEYAHAKAIIGDALPLFWEMGSRRSRILFLNTLGDIECKLGEYMEAKLHFEESLQLSRALNYRVNTGVALVSLGRVAYGLGNYAESSQFCRESLVICEDTGNAWGKSFALAHLGRAHAALGEFHEAQAHYEHSLQLSQEIGNRWVMCFTLRQCGRLAAQHGAWQSAAHYLYESLLLARDMNVPPLILDALAGAAGCLAQSSTPHGLERAQAIASYVSNHPITEYEARRDANALLEPDTQSSDEPLDSVAAIGLSWLEEILTVDSTSRE